MVKKSVSSPKFGKKKMTAREREELLIENFVGLQKAMTNLSIKFEGMTGQINKLLEVFELAARNFVSGGGSSEDNTDVLKKIDSLLDQNKTIAKGLVLIEDKIRGREQPGFNRLMSPNPSLPFPPQRTKPLDSGTNRPNVKLLGT